MKGVCFFDFDLRVEWLHHSSKEKVFDKLIGMRFLRGSDVVELQCVNEEELKALVPFLSAKLNLLNFHTTYKAIKKIGKGNFASVFNFKFSVRLKYLEGLPCGESGHKPAFCRQGFLEGSGLRAGKRQGNQNLISGVWG